MPIRSEWTPVRYQAVSVPLPNISVVPNRGILTGLSRPVGSPVTVQEVETIPSNTVTDTVNYSDFNQNGESPMTTPTIDSKGIVEPRMTTSGKGLKYTIGSDLDRHLIAESQKYGVDPNLVRAVMRQESDWTHGGKGNTSSAGAYGYMQLMADTAKDLGVDRMDPYQNITGGIKYLSEMYKRFGNWEDALRGYNAGPGVVLKVQAGKRGYAPETVAYVPKVMGYYNQYKTMY